MFLTSWEIQKGSCLQTYGIKKNSKVKAIDCVTFFVSKRLFQTAISDQKFETGKNKTEIATYVGSDLNLSVAATTRA